MEGKSDVMYMNHPSNKHGEWKEERHRKRNSTKISDPRVQGIVENKMEAVEVENTSLCPHRYILNRAPTVECTSLRLKNDWTLQPVKL